jgi:hypothetical protein
MPRDTAGSSAAHETCTCTVCGRVYKYDRRKGHTRRRCNSCGSTRATREERLELKERMLAYKGGRCTRCGFDSWPEALGFHHLDKANKRFPIAWSHGRCWETLRRELDKCMVVCLNCHAEIHDAAVRQGITRVRLPHMPSSALLPPSRPEREALHDRQQSSEALGVALSRAGPVCPALPQLPRSRSR